MRDFITRQSIGAPICSGSGTRPNFGVSEFDVLARQCFGFRAFDLISCPRHCHWNSNPQNDRPPIGKLRSSRCSPSAPPAPSPQQVQDTFPPPPFPPATHPPRRKSSVQPEYFPCLYTAPPSPSPSAVLSAFPIHRRKSSIASSRQHVSTPSITSARQHVSITPSSPHHALPESSPRLSHPPSPSPIQVQAQRFQHFQSTDGSQVSIPRVTPRPLP